mmetsp:Transcript_20129/g.77194  ORF Transcript_20129/g.77194 Transcript_20129/m.77194 type:complete len:242 (+) Transcript_20129:1237-1962(+)
MRQVPSQPRPDLEHVLAVASVAIGPHKGVQIAQHHGHSHTVRRHEVVLVRDWAPELGSAAVLPVRVEAAPAAGAQTEARLREPPRAQHLDKVEDRPLRPQNGVVRQRLAAKLGSLRRRGHLGRLRDANTNCHCGCMPEEEEQQAANVQQREHRSDESQPCDRGLGLEAEQENRVSSDRGLRLQDLDHERCQDGQLPRKRRKQRQSLGDVQVGRLKGQGPDMKNQENQRDNSHDESLDVIRR